MDTPPLYAHRLGRSYGPDSSAQALAGALAAGVDGLETDVCLTADERLVLLHDPLLRLGTTLDGWAHDRTAAEIQHGWLRDRDGEPTEERPMTLEELLDATPSDLPVQVEVKAHADPGLAVRTADVLCDRYRLDPARQRIEVISFHSAACAAAAAHGFRARLVIHADYAPDALALWAVRHGVKGISIEHFLLSSKLAATLRLAGLSLATGTVNDAELLARVAALAPLDGVCTDRPAELRAGLRLVLATGPAGAEPVASGTVPSRRIDRSTESFSQSAASRVRTGTCGAAGTPGTAAVDGRALGRGGSG